MSEDENQKNNNDEQNKDVEWEALGLPTPLLNAVKALGWDKPTPIQAQTIPYGLTKKDVIGLAKTGSGKTAAFVLPILAQLLQKSQSFFACIISPTRELAYQIGEQIESIGSSIGISVAVIVGGLSLQNQAIILGKKPHLVVGTPGRLVKHLQNTKGFNLNNIKFLVLDEADRLLNLDFEEEINTILKLVPKERTTFLFSATMTSRVEKLQRASLVNPVRVHVNQKYSTVEELTQNYLFIPDKYKDCYLVYLLTEFTGKSIIIFTIQCNTCQTIALILRNLGFGAIPLHGKMTQTKRLGSLNKFKSKERNILVATDVASRGIDIEGVDLVLNYEIPTHPKEYIHRVGRTARAGNSGLAISIVTQYDVEDYKKIEEYIGMQLQIYPTDREAALISLERIAEAQRMAAMEMRESGFGQNKRKHDNKDYNRQPKNKRNNY
jgi:ATP-dependent RNA helicase DDX47/RRP3